MFLFSTFLFCTFHFEQTQIIGLYSHTFSRSSTTICTTLPPLFSLWHSHPAPRIYEDHRGLNNLPPSLIVNLHACLHIVIFNTRYYKNQTNSTLTFLSIANPNGNSTNPLLLKQCFIFCQTRCLFLLRTSSARSLSYQTHKICVIKKTKNALTPKKRKREIDKLK